MLREGASVRIVGSHHYWLEDGGPRCVLLLVFSVNYFYRRIASPKS